MKAGDISGGGGRILFLAMAAAMGGFLFGYDTAVINGGERQIQSVWNLSSFVHGLVMSSALWGTVVGAAFGGKVCDRICLKPTLFWVGVLYLVSVVWSAFAFFGACLCAHLVWAMFGCPETKGKALEEMDT